MVVSEERRQERQERIRRIRRLQRRYPVPGVRVATEEEGKELFDFQARKTLGISGDEFLRRWDAGEYRRLDESPEGRKVMHLAMLIPFARRTPR